MTEPGDHQENLLFMFSVAHWRIHALLKDHFRKMGLAESPEQYFILLNLLNQGPQYQQNLARSQHKDKAAIKRLLDQLEKTSLVSRQPSLTDKRKKEVRITPKGIKKTRQLDKIAESTLKNACADLSEVELNALKRLIGRVQGKE